MRDLILVSEDEASQLMGVSKPTLRDWTRRSLIAPVQLPGGIRRNLYRRQDLEDFAASLPTMTTTGLVGGNQ